MAISAKLMDTNVFYHCLDRLSEGCFKALAFSRGSIRKAKQAALPMAAHISYHPSFSVTARFKGKLKKIQHSDTFACAAGEARDGDELQEAQEAVAELLQESGIPREEALIISYKAPVYAGELVDSVHELDELSLWSSWEVESGAEDGSNYTFKNKILQIAKRKGDGGLLPFLESIGVKPSSTPNISRYLSSEPLPRLFEKIKFLRDLFSPANFQGKSIGNMVRYMMMRLSVSADDDLQQTLSFFEKMEARRGGLSILDSKDVVLAHLVESFPKILLQSMDVHIKPLVEFLEAVGVPKGFVGNVLLCFPPIILYDVEMELRPRVRTLKKVGIQARHLGNMLMKYPWLLSMCIQENVNEIVTYFVAAKVPKKNVDHAITRCPQLLGCSIDTLKLTMNQINGLGIKGKKLGRIIAFSPKLLLRRPREFMEVVSFMEELGFSNESMGKILHRCPEIYASSVEHTLKRKVEFLIELGILDTRLRRVLKKYPEVLVMDVEHALKPRMEYLKQVGLSKENVAFMVSGFPPLLGYSIEEVLKPKLNYLINVMQRSAQETVTYPRYFSYSLEKKIKPRFRVLQNRRIECSLKLMLSKGDDEFAEEYLGVGRMLVPPLKDL